jgi:hypothetical protein
MINYRTAILSSVYKIEKAFSREDIETISRKDMASLVVEIYDILRDAVADWWDRDEQAEDMAKQRFLDSM